VSLVSVRRTVQLAPSAEALGALILMGFEIEAGVDVVTSACAREKGGVESNIDINGKQGCAPVFTRGPQILELLDIR